MVLPRFFPVGQFTATVFSGFPVLPWFLHMLCFQSSKSRSKRISTTDALQSRLGNRGSAISISPYTEEGLSLLSIESRESPSLCRGESVSPFSIERRQKRECPSSLWRRERLFTFCRGESVYLLYTEERETLVSTEEGVSLLSIERRETPALCRGESVSPFSSERRQKKERPSSLWRRERLLLSAEERVSVFSIQRKETLSLYRGGSVSLVYRKERYSCPLQRRERLSLLYREEAEERVSLFSR